MIIPALHWDKTKTAHMLSQPRTAVLQSMYNTFEIHVVTSNATPCFTAR